MKKHALVVAALAALATTAQAQSSVELYGIIDLALTRGNGGTAANAGGNGTSKATQLKQSTSSRFGLRGNEDLGGGLSAQFFLDARFRPDTGEQNNATSFFSGKSTVQLTSKDYGAVWGGRDYTPAFFVGVKVDPFGWDGVGQVGIGQYADYRSTSSTQVTDAVGYKSPNINGFSTAITVSMGEGVKARENGVNVEYAKGPLYVGVGYGGQVGGGATSDGNRIVNLGASYDLGYIKPMLYTARTKTGGGKLSNSMFMIGARVPFGASVIKLAYSEIDPSGANNDQKKFSLGYEYYLSKRTNIYVDAGLAREDRKTNNNAYALGIRHKF